MLQSGRSLQFVRGPCPGGIGTPPNWGMTVVSAPVWDLSGAVRRAVKPIYGVSTWLRLPSRRNGPYFHVPLQAAIIETQDIGTRAARTANRPLR